MQQLAESPSQHQPQPIPYGLVSLWDMINCRVGSYIILLDVLEILETAVRRPYPRNALLVEPKSKEWLSTMDSLKGQVDVAKDLAAPLNSYVLNSQIRSLGWAIEFGDESSQNKIADKIALVRDTIKTELSNHFFYHYPRDKAILLNDAPKDWAAAIAAFPSAEEDILAAVDCYALGHNNASIYHSMMVLELGLPALALKLKTQVKKARPTWRDITDDIRAKIDQRRVALANTPKGKKPLSRPAAKKEHTFLEHCGEAALDFKFFEHAWRNHVAHGRGDYDENDAKKVLEHVRTFMEVIAGKLKLKERR